MYLQIDLLVGLFIQFVTYNRVIILTESKREFVITVWSTDSNLDSYFGKETVLK